MTNPVILLGTQSNGETLPVQVDATGRLVAEGLQGEPGQPGPPGPEGPAGEFPDGAYEGAVLGWQDGSAVWMDSPSGLPEPLGIEGQIIQIVEGEPIWITNPSVPPTPVFPITAVTGTTAPDGSFGLFDGSGTLQPSVLDWDTYCRTQAFWETPQQLNPSGIACKELETLSTEFIVKGAPGTVLEMTCTARGYQTLDKNADVFFDASATNDNLVVINNRLSNKTYSDGWYAWTHTFQWLINRPDIGATTFNFSLYGGGFNPTREGSHHSLTHWEVIDAGRAALNNQMKLAAEVEEFRAQVKALSEVGVTTDIDLLRPS